MPPMATRCAENPQRHSEVSPNPDHPPRKQVESPPQSLPQHDQNNQS
jgi:hypothetical protein